MVKPIPEGYHSITPYLVVEDAKAAIDFYTRAFGAREKFRLPIPVPSDAAGGVEGGERIGHAELIIGDSHVMLADAFPEQGHRGPKALGGTPVSLMLYVEDVDSTFRQAIQAGATEKRPVENQFWGDRLGTLTDPFGHVWSLATTVEEVAPDELQRRMEQFAKGQKQSEPA